MLSVLAIGDLHLRDSAAEQQKKMLDSIECECLKHKPDLIVLLGDTLHRHEHIEMRSLCQAIDFFNRLAKISKVVVLIGNHDRENPTDFLSPMHPFTSLECSDRSSSKFKSNLMVVSTTKMININDLDFCLVPYVPPGRFEDALSMVDGWKEADAIFAHQEFRGCKLGSISSKTGDRWNKDLPLVISGHIHDYHWLLPNMVYVGTPSQHSFGEKSRKTISLFQFKQGCYKETRIDLDLKRRITVRLTCKEAKSYKPPPDAIVRIVLRDSEPAMKAFIASKKDSRIRSKVEKLSYDVIRDDGYDYNSNMDFMTLLRESVKDVPGEVKEFNRMFG